MKRPGYRDKEVFGLNRRENQHRPLRTALFSLLLLVLPFFGDWLIRRWRAEMSKFYHYSLWPAILHYFLIMLFGLALGAWQNGISLGGLRSSGLVFDRARALPIVAVCSAALVLWYMKLLTYGDMLPTVAACLLGYGISSSCSVKPSEAAPRRGPE